jgi:TonB dependent receptor
VSTDFLIGTTTVAGATGACATGCPLFQNSYGNLSRSRYEGIEAAITRSPKVGFGYVVQGSLMRGFALGVPTGDYFGKPGIVNGVNFSDQSVSNQAIPYSQGYVEANWHNADGEMVLLGGDVLRREQRFQSPAATMFFNLSARVPIRSPQTNLQLSVDNLFNKNGGLFPTLYRGAGIPYQPTPSGLGQTYATTLKDYGPRQIRISISHDFGHELTDPVTVSLSKGVVSAELVEATHGAASSTGSDGGFAATPFDKLRVTA